MFEQEQNKNFITGFSGTCYILHCLRENQ